MNFLELAEIAHDKESALRFLQQHGIGLVHTDRRCSKQHIMTLSLTDKQDRWRCHQGQCKEDIAVRRGTWLEGSKLSYRQVVLFFYFYPGNILGWEMRCLNVFCTMSIWVQMSTMIT